MFYRGLGNFRLPLVSTVEADRAAFSNPVGEKTVTAVFLVQVTPTAAGFVELGALAGGEQRTAQIPEATMPLGQFVEVLRARLTAVLVADGLLTPAYERQLAQWLNELSQSPTAEAATAKFLALGRFSEPHLTRAVRLTKDAGEKAAGEALLVKIHGQRKWAPTAVE